MHCKLQLYDYYILTIFVNNFKLSVKKFSNFDKLVNINTTNKLHWSKQKINVHC